MIHSALVEKVLDQGLSTGADFAEVFVEDRDNNVFTYNNGQIDEISNGIDYGLGLRLIKGEEVIYAYTSDLSEDNLMRMAKQTSGAFKGSPREKVMPFHAAPERGLLPIRLDPQNIALKQKLELLEKAYAAALAYDPVITQANITYHDHKQKVLIANSEGLWVEDERVRTRFATYAIATHNGEMQTGSSSPGAGLGFEFFESHDVEEIAREAARIAKTMVYADYAPSGAMPVILDNAFGGVLFHEACGHGLEASFVSKGTSVYTGKLGQQIASPLVTAIDDGTQPNQWGTLNYDDEGTPTQRNLLIENGILKAYLVDRFNGKRMGMESTGSCRRQSYRFIPTSRMNNTFIAAGESTLDEIIAATESGLYAKKLGGGSVDITSGEFNFAVEEGYLVKNGKIEKPVRGASIVGTGLEVLQRIDMVGNDLVCGQGMCGAASGSLPVNVGQPPLRISKLTVGGR